MRRLYSVDVLQVTHTHTFARARAHTHTRTHTSYTHIHTSRLRCRYIPEHLNELPSDSELGDLSDNRDTDVIDTWDPVNHEDYARAREEGRVATAAWLEYVAPSSLLSRSLLPSFTHFLHSFPLFPPAIFTHFLHSFPLFPPAIFTRFLVFFFFFFFFI
jgi:hypothetical protein